jgi:hypothetical protein
MDDASKVFEADEVTASRNGARVISNLLFAVVQPFAPVIAMAFGGLDIGAQSDRWTSMFTPPDFAFAIWGLIFIAMIVYGIHQALPNNWANARLRRIGWFTAAAMGLNIAWMIVTPLVGLGTFTTVIIFLMLAALMMAFTALYRDGKPSARNTGSVIFPVSIFAGWITVACTASAAGWLRNEAGFEGGSLPEGVWVAALAIVGALIGAGVMVRNRGNIYYGAVLVWGLSTIAIKCSRLDETIAVYGVMAAILIVVVGYGYVRRQASAVSTGDRT